MMETIRIPIRATYSRSERGAAAGFEPKMLSAEYADVPAALMMGTMAQCAKAHAQSAGDDEAAQIITEAMDKARAAGDMMDM